MPLTFEFTLSPDEFLAGHRVFSRSLATPIHRFTCRWAVPIGVLLLLESVAGFALQLNNIGLCLGAAGFGAYLVLCRTLIWPYRVKKEFTQYPEFAVGLKMEFLEDKMLVQTSQGKSETALSRFTRFAETDKLFVLFAAPRFLYMIPKRVLSLDESDQFRQLLHRRLQGAKLPR